MSCETAEPGVLTYNGVAVYETPNNSASGVGPLFVAATCPVALTNVGVSVKVGEGPAVEWLPVLNLAERGP